MNYTYRMHDPRVGRFFAIDPLAAKYPYYSTYAFSGNRVIDSKEIEGLEPENIHYYNMVKQKNGNHKAVYHHSSSNLIIKSANTFFKNSITKKQTDVSSGNYGPQENMTNVYTYWNSDGTIAKQVFVSKEITKTRVGYAYENNGIYKAGVFETGTFDNDGLLKYQTDFKVLSAQASGIDDIQSVGGEVSASGFQAEVGATLGNKDVNITVKEERSLFTTGAKAIAYDLLGGGMDIEAKAAVVEGKKEASANFYGLNVKASTSACAVCAQIGATSVFHIDEKNKVLNIKIGGDLGLMLGVGLDLDVNIKYGDK